ncbi:MAG: hypothetical protein AAB367_03280 [Patescibacteria group bacterium]
MKKYLLAFAVVAASGFVLAGVNAATSGCGGACSIDAGADRTITNNTVQLQGSVNPGALLNASVWTVVSAPGGANPTFSPSSVQATNPTVTFPSAGAYVLRFSAATFNSGVISDDVRITVQTAGGGSSQRNFGVGDAVETTDVVKVRSTPGGVYIASRPSGAVGEIFGGPQQATYQGISYWWWSVAFPSITGATNPSGWVAEDYLVRRGAAGNIRVNAGPDKGIASLSTVLAGTVNPPGTPVTWKKKSGPGNVEFQDSHNLATRVTFSTRGVYVLGLCVYGDYCNEVTINVSTTSQVNCSQEQYQAYLDKFCPVGFDPRDINWGGVGGIGLNDYGPYHPCNIKNLPVDGITAGGCRGAYSWPVGGEQTTSNSPSFGSYDQNASDIPGAILTMIEAANPNWVRALKDNGISFNPPARMSSRYIANHLEDGPYKWVGIDSTDKGFLPLEYADSWVDPAELATGPGNLPSCYASAGPTTQMYGYAQGWWGLPGGDMNPDGSRPGRRIPETGRCVPDFRDWRLGDPIPQYTGGPQPFSYLGCGANWGSNSSADEVDCDTQKIYACTANKTNALVGEQVTFTAPAGVTPIEWNAPYYASPASQVEGQSFTTSFSQIGNQSARFKHALNGQVLQDGCSVIVYDPNPGTLPPPPPPPSPGAALQAGDRVETAGDYYVRVGIGVSSQPTTGQPNPQPAGIRGTLLQKSSVIANGTYWWRVDFDTGPDGWTAQAGLRKVISNNTPPPPPPPPTVTPPPPATVPPPPPSTTPPPTATPPPPAPASCSNNWNSTNGGYYKKPGTSCPCQYFTATGGQPIGPAAPSSCSPVTLPPPPPPATGLNLSPQRAGSPQTGQILRVPYSTTLVSNSFVDVYTGTDFPVTSGEARLSKPHNGGTLLCQPSTFMTRYGMLVEASGGNSTVFKLNGQSESDGLFVWWRGQDGSYDWRRMTLDEYRAEDRFYDLPGWYGVPYAPNCIVQGLFGTITNPPPPPPTVTPPPPPAPLPPPPPPAELKYEVGARVRIKPHATLGDITVNYRNDPLPDGKCGTTIGEKATGVLGTITQSMVECGAGRYWKVSFDGGQGEGWVVQNRLQPISPSAQNIQLDAPAIANTLQGLRQSIENLQNILNQH